MSTIRYRHGQPARHVDLGLRPPEYEWLDEPRVSIWRRINWWRVVPLVLSFAVVAGTTTMCSVTMF